MLKKYKKVKLSKPAEHRTGIIRRPLPSNIEKILEKLDGSEMRLSRAIRMIKSESKKRGKLIIFYDERMIGLQVGGYPLPQGYQLLNFEYTGAT